MNSTEMLIFLQSQGIINLNDVQEKMKEEERKRLLKNIHIQFFTMKRTIVGKQQYWMKQRKMEGD